MPVMMQEVQRATGEIEAEADEHTKGFHLVVQTRKKPPLRDDAQRRPNQ